MVVKEFPFTLKNQGPVQIPNQFKSPLREGGIGFPLFCHVFCVFSVLGGDPRLHEPRDAGGPALQQQDGSVGTGLCASDRFWMD